MGALFITFEGGEGAGKSTQIGLLKTALEQRGYTVIATREPGGTQKAETIRRMLLSGAVRHMGPYSEALMFFIARGDHVREVIAPALEAGTIVLCDRFSDSTLVYQGIANGMDTDELRALERVVIGDIRPDMTVILDVPEEVGLARVARRRAGTGKPDDRFEAENAAFHRRLREGFRQLAKREPGRCVLIDSTPPKEAVAAAILARVEERLAGGRRQTVE
ncbi:MAG: dTMP kinase [Methylobacteriaceae bacterium]|jgi:dTMP kinase|nr:dTMP kinase [Methylobacteriaceae bacterium]